MDAQITSFSDSILAQSGPDRHDVTGLCDSKAQPERPAKMCDKEVTHQAENDKGSPIFSGKIHGDTLAFSEHQEEGATAQALSSRKVEHAFTRFPSIHDISHQKQIDNMIKANPGLKDQLFVITEKMNGTNISVLISSDDITYHQRGGGEIDSKNKFYGLPEAFSADCYERDFRRIQSRLDKTGAQLITLRGEWFGTEIGPQKILYDTKCEYALFSVQKDLQYLTYKELHEFVGEMKFDKLSCVPELISGVSYGDALKYPVENVRSQRRSKNDTDNTDKLYMEGIVIQPYDALINIHGVDGKGPFYIKKKAARFQEKPPVNRGSDESLKDRFLKYTTNSIRIDNQLLKKTYTKSELPDLVNTLIFDAQNDFLKVYPETQKDKLKAIATGRSCKGATYTAVTKHCPDIFQS